MTKEAQSILYPNAMPLYCDPPSEPTETEWLAAEKETHKRAFRVAFDELNRLWPPENTLDYWVMVTDRMALASNDNKDNGLCKMLLLMLVEYLEQVGKDRERRYGQHRDTADAGMDGG